ncbi:MAG: hypothetical protein AAGF93_14680 [Cyanobacteria bacterium P01_H01_bin.105]
MSSVQTGQLISLLVNNVLMVIIVMVVTIAAWLRWCWLQSGAEVTLSLRRRCRWAYVSFVLTVVTLLGMLTSLGVLTLRAMIAMNALVMGAMAIFLLSVVTLLVALGLWLVDLCSDLPILPVARPSRKGKLLHIPALSSASIAVSTRRRRAQRKQRR